MATKRAAYKKAKPAGRKGKAVTKRKPAAAKGAAAKSKPAAKRQPAKRKATAKGTAAKRYPRLHVCTDRVVTTDLVRPHHVMRFGPVGRVRAVIFFRKLWVNGSTLRVRFLGGSAAQQANAKKQAGWWEKHANVKFDFNDAPDAEIRIAFDPNDGAWSYIGTDAKTISQGDPTMNLGFEEGGTAAHEFGHALGFGHEHQNPAGGIVWNEPRVLQDLAGPPNSWTPSQIRHNVLEKYKVDQIRGTQFDPDSIMLYFFPGNWVQSGVGTKANSVLSKKDIAFVKSTEGYPPTVAAVVPLQINGAAQSGSIGSPGEEDLYSFPVTQPGRHVIETGGQTDVVMKLFGPDSQTSLVAEDDDSGFGFNARISADLIAGTYVAQVRHFNRSGGTGSYTVSVKR